MTNGAGAVDGRSIRNQAVIVGIGNTEYSSASGRSELRLALEACMAALDDAGVERKQVDGLVRFGVSQTGASEAWMAVNLGLPNLRYWGAVDFGGSGSTSLVVHAAAAVASGLASYVLCYRSVNGRSGLRPGTSDTYERLLRGADPSFDNYAVPYGFTAPNQGYAMIARRHMHEYGTTLDDLGAVAVQTRDNANRYPGAQMYGKPLTLDSYYEAPYISDPLRRFDCCLQTDGAAAVLVTTPERAKDLKWPAVHIAGAVQATNVDLQGALMSSVGQADVLHTAGYAAASDLYAQTGLRPGDVDVAQLYDCFTITTLLQLEAYGFCNRGESGPFVTGGGISPEGGSIPINTDGGNLSAGYIHGVNHILEGTRQIRGTSTSQVRNAETCLVTAGLPTPTSALMLTKEPL